MSRRPPPSGTGIRPSRDPGYGNSISSKSTTCSPIHRDSIPAPSRRLPRSATSCGVARGDMNVAKTPSFIMVAQRTTVRVPSCDANRSSRHRRRQRRRDHRRGQRHRPRRGAALRRPGLRVCWPTRMRRHRDAGTASARGHRRGDRRRRPLDDVEALAQTVARELGEVAVLMNNAGIGGGGDAAVANPDGLARVLDVNLWGVMQRRAGLRTGDDRAAARRARSINTGSKQGITTPPGDAAYNVSKAGGEGRSPRGSRTTLRNRPAAGSRPTC